MYLHLLPDDKQGNAKAGAALVTFARDVHDIATAAKLITSHLSSS